MARVISSVTPQVAARPSAANAAWALARTGATLMRDAATDIIHELLMQSMLATDLASMLAGTLTSLAARLFGSARAAFLPARVRAALADDGRRCPDESARG
jgi:hypothetical protein